MAPLIVIGYEGIAFVLSLMSGAKMVAAPHLSMGMFIMLVLFGGQWEELGWTGYALPRLRERFSNRSNGSLIAVLVLGVFRMIWHLPLFLYAKMDWFDIFIFTFAFQIIIAWVYDRSESVPVVMTLHFTSNILGAAMSVVFLGADQVAYRVLFVTVASLFAVSLVVFSQLKAQQRKAVVV
jgi:membrane protease YdiL (CAAX protease family)